MEVKEAVTVAKKWVRDILSDENAQNIGLEEVELDESKGLWHITVGFSRPWNSPKDGQIGTGLAAALALTQPLLKRAYRIVTIRDRDSKVLSMKRRSGGDA